MIVLCRKQELRPWQRSWGRRLGIRKGGIEPQESPWIFSSIYPQNQSLPTLLLCALTYTSDFTGGLSWAWQECFSSQPWEVWDVLNCLNTDAFEQLKDWLEKKTGNRTALWSSNPTAGHTHWGNQKGKRHVYPNVHRSTVYNSQDMEAT